MRSNCIFEPLDRPLHVLKALTYVAAVHGVRSDSVSTQVFDKVRVVSLTSKVVHHQLEAKGSGI